MKKYPAVLIIAFLFLSALPYPVSAEQNLIYKGGTVQIEAYSTFAFNWTWWGTDKGQSLSFWYTTNNEGDPVMFMMNNTYTMLFYTFDYFYAITWNRTDFPTDNSLWWFTFSNQANRTISLTVGVHYRVEDYSSATWMTTVIIVGTFVAVLVGFLGAMWWFVWRKKGYSLTTMRNSRGL